MLPRNFAPQQPWRQPARSAMAAAWLLVVALAQRARCVPHPSTAGVDLYEAIGASRGAATEVLLADQLECAAPAAG